MVLQRSPQQGRLVISAPRRAQWASCSSLTRVRMVSAGVLLLPCFTHFWETGSLNGLTLWPDDGHFSVAPLQFAGSYISTPALRAPQLPFGIAPWLIIWVRMFWITGNKNVPVHMFCYHSVMQYKPVFFWYVSTFYICIGNACNRHEV